MIKQKIIDFYHRVDEANRLEEAAGKLEYARTIDLLGRFLPDPPAVILDVGGAAGVYSFPLAERGYSVHLIDPVPGHIEQARAQRNAPDPVPDVQCSVGDTSHTVDSRDKRPSDGYRYKTRQTVKEKSTSSVMKRF